MAFTSQREGTEQMPHSVSPSAVAAHTATEFIPYRGGVWLIVTGDDRTDPPCVMGGRELKGQDGWLHPAGLSSPPWIYHPLLIRGSRLCLMWTSPSCVPAGREDTACHVQAKGSQTLELSSCPQELAS